MNKGDGRLLSEASLELLRGQAHRLRQQGRTWAEIASIVGVHLSTVMSWSRRFGLGSAALSEVASARRGRRCGEGRTLAVAEEVMLRAWVVSGPPSALALPHALWSRRAVQQAVRIKFDLDMPIRTVGEYLRRWGFTPQRPAKRALEQRPAQVQQWLQVDFPAIARRAKAEQAVVQWADETAVRQDTAWVRGYAAAGHTPVVAHAARRPSPSLTLISAVSQQGLVQFSLHDGAVDTERFIGFLTALVQDTPPKVFLIVDNLAVHRAGRVRQWVEDHRDRIELFYLPPYSPQMNPDEWLNRDLKTELRLRPATRDREALKAMACRFMQTLKQTPQRIKQYFDDEHLAYACV